MEKRIGLNLMFVAPGVAGGRVYADGLLRGLSVTGGDVGFLIYTRRDVELPELPVGRFQHVRVPVSGSAAYWRALWEYGLLPREVRRDGCHLLHGLGNLSPSVRRLPFVLTLHDVTYKHFPQSQPLGYRLFMQCMQPGVARRADRVIVPSNHTADNAVRLLGVKPERVRLVRYGPGHGFQPVTDSTAIDETLSAFKIRRPFVISVARGYPHKNLHGLLEAMARLADMGQPDTQLVVVGAGHRVGSNLAALAVRLGLTERVVHTGGINQNCLNRLYSAAAVCAFPSLSEGFGLPILEAMACGTPVVASNASAVPEAVGGAGVLADARDPTAFAAALARVLREDRLRRELRENGFLRVKEFSWEKCAAETMAVYREVM